jgi:hypothetical protein
VTTLGDERSRVGVVPGQNTVEELNRFRCVVLQQRRRNHELILFVHEQERRQPGCHHWGEA